MPDSARSSDPAVQRQLDRLTMLSPGRDVLGLERIAALLDRLGNPQNALPPVFHVAGTNGKGSTCAFLRAAIEAAGLKVHVYSSPHLVRFNERIRVAGALIADDALAPLLAEVLDCSEDIHPSFFEATTAAAFLAFTRTPADACVIEVGLGGRLDATNIIPRPVMCGIAQLGVDHQAFLGETAIEIAAEKAGIAKPGVPLITMDYDPPVAKRVEEVALANGAPVLMRKAVWDAAIYENRLHYRDSHGTLSTPLPRLPGAHQAMNAALAFAMLRHQTDIHIPESALRAATGWAEWPARLQRLHEGPLKALLPGDAELWLDGGHNPAAGALIANHFREAALSGRPLRIILGMLENKDAEGLLAPFAGLGAQLIAVPVPDHAHHDPAALAEAARKAGIAEAGEAADFRTALESMADETGDRPIVLILGSLYLAGAVLAANDEIPD